jgi:hypothetical protein
MTEIDKRIGLPDGNEKFLEWYQEVFDCVYIALHPFSSVLDLDPETVNYRLGVFNGNETSLEEAMEQMSEIAANTDTDQVLFAKLEKQFGKQTLWQRICEECKFDSVAELNRVLLTTNMALRPEHWDEAGAARLEGYCVYNKVFMPIFNWIPPLLQKPLAETFKALGLQDFVVANQFDYQINSATIEDLETDQPWTVDNTEWNYVCKAYSRDYSILVASPIDEFYTIICGNNRNTFEKIGLSERFDGFWCTEDTRPAWWLTETQWLAR